MKLAVSQLVPAEYTRSSVQQVVSAIENQVNLLAEGRLTGRHFNATAAPTTGNFSIGDIVWDSAPSKTNGSVRLGWICTAAGTPGTFEEIRTLVANFAPISNALSSGVALNNTATFFTGPSVAQGTSGTWFVVGTVTVQDDAGAAVFSAKLWDGTTVIAAGRSNTVGATSPTTISLSGFITSPAGNLRISVKDETSTSGFIDFNVTGTSKDSTITAVRIG